MSLASPPKNRFLVIAPVGRDCELIRLLLKSRGFESMCLERISEITPAGFSELIALMITDEALAGNGIDQLRALIKLQPAWSDLPVILLTSAQMDPRSAGMTSQLRAEMSSLFLLDRPVRMESLISAAQVAFTARMKQFEIRDAGVKQSQADQVLRNSEKLAVAGRLAATLAHEVNNPLEAMSNLLFLIQNSSSIQEAKSICTLASQELERISEIVNSTLRFHRASGEPEFCSLFEIASSALGLFRSKLKEQHIHANLQGDRVTAFCSSGEIRQAVVNLIGNAVDAMPRGGTLHVRLARVRVHGVSYARVTVGDTGTGIPNEIRANLFKQFFTTKGSRGTGLGLWLTKDIVARSQGKLRMRTCTGSPSGTVFSIYLPTRRSFETGSIEASDQKGRLKAVGTAQRAG